MSGIYGVASSEDCIELLFYGTDYHSHLGTSFGGLAVLGDNFVRQIHDISQTQFKSKFFEVHQQMKGYKGIGVVSDCDEQPIFLNCKIGPFYIVTMGLLTNKEELAKSLFAQGKSLSETGGSGINATEIVAKLISQGKSIEDGIEKMFEVIEGSCSLLILHNDGIYAARDRHGYTPLIVGFKQDEWAVASESTAFPNLDFEFFKEIQPGEIVLLNEDGLVTRRPGGTVNQICTFLWIYTGFPASCYEGISVEMVRENCGKFLAKADKDIESDLASGVPDSGIGHAIGYAIEAGIPYRRPLVKYTPGYGRSYTPPSQETRDLIARMKLVPVREVINGHRIILCEDSIVRGTQLKNHTIKKLWDAGATEIHVRPACPPLMFPCKYCLSTRSIKELAARKAIRFIEGHDTEDVSEYVDNTSKKHKEMVEWIRSDINITTLRYQKIENMVQAVGLPQEKLCLYCWNGVEP